MGADVIRLRLNQSKEKNCKLSKMCTFTCLFIWAPYKNMDLKLLCWLWCAVAIVAFKRWKKKLRRNWEGNSGQIFLNKECSKTGKSYLCIQVPCKLSLHLHREGGAEPCVSPNRAGRCCSAKASLGTFISIFQISTCVLALERGLELIGGLS